jgi:hypothetical protein
MLGPRPAVVNAAVGPENVGGERTLNVTGTHSARPGGD